MGMNLYQFASTEKIGSIGTSPFPTSSGICGRLTTISATSMAARWLPTAI